MTSLGGHRMGLRVDRVERVESIAVGTLTRFDGSDFVAAAPELLGISPTKVIVLDMRGLGSRAGRQTP